MLHPAPGRWPEHEVADRLELGVGAVAVAARRAPEPRWAPTRQVLVALATGLAAADRGALPGDLVMLDPLGPVGPLAVVPWEGEGRARVDFDLVDSVAGSVPGLPVEPAEAGPAVEIAAVALVVALAADDPPARLPLALGIEGVLAWLRESGRSLPGGG